MHTDIVLNFRGVWAHGSTFAKLNVKQTVATRSKQHIGRGFKCKTAAMCARGYLVCLAPLVIFAQLCNDQGFLPHLKIENCSLLVN